MDQDVDGTHEQNGSDGTVEKYPIDFDALKQGDYLSRADLEGRLDATPGTVEWQFALLSLKEQIEKQTPHLTRIDHDGLRILTAAEGDDHTDRMFKQAMTTMGRQLRRRAKIKREDLPETERVAFDLRNQRILGVVSATRREYRKQSRGLFEEIRRRQLAAAGTESKQ